ncbi:MAG: hypothetical protein AAGI23_04060 [Bacteroidota bacterium]
MTKSIHQTYRNNFKKYKVTKDGLALELKNGNDYIAYTVDYEDLGFDEIVRGIEPTRYEYLLLASATINAILVIALGVVLASKIWLSIVVGTIFLGGLLYWAKMLLRLCKTKILEGSQNIAFFYFPEQQTAVDEFIKVLKESRRKYLRRKYMKYDDMDDDDIQQSTYLWLYREKLISRDELQLLNEEINNGRIIGGL